VAQAVSADLAAPSVTPVGVQPAAPPAAAPKAEAVPTGAEPVKPTQSEAAPAIGVTQPSAPEPAPAIGFTLGGLLDAVVPGDADAATRVLFHDGFDEGLADWVSRGLGQATAIANPDTVVLAGTKARRSLWIKTRSEIDLAASTEPRLRLDFKGAPVALKAVWETDSGAFPEEIMLTAVEPAADAAKDAGPEFDLSDLRGRPGHLVLVARATKGEAAPVLDAVTIYDAEALAH